MKISSLPHYRLLVILALLGLIGCSSSPSPVVMEQPAVSKADARISLLLEDAAISSGDAAMDLRLRAADAMVDDRQFRRAENELLELLNRPQLPPAIQLRGETSLGKILLQQGETESALQRLELVDEQTIEALSAENVVVRNYHLMKGDTYLGNGIPDQAVVSYSRSSSNIAPNADAHQKIWLALNQFSDSQLTEFAAVAGNYQTRGWVELIRIIRADQFSIKKQIESVSNWRRIWSQHAAVDLLPKAVDELNKIWEQRPRHIALILPLQLSAGNAIQEGFLSAYYQDLAISRDVPHISVYDSSNALTIIPIYNQAVAAGADLVIGPLDKALVTELSELDELPVKTLALNYTEESFEAAPGLIQFGLAPEDEIEQAIELAWTSGFRNAAIITPDSEDYSRFQTMFQELWTKKGGELVSQTRYSSNADYAAVIKRLMAIDSSEDRASRLLDILPRNNMEFTPRRRQDIDFIFMIANPRQGRQIKPTLAFYFAGDLPVYSLPSIYDGLQNPAADQDLNGITFTDAPWILNDGDPLKAEVESSLRQVPGPLRRLRALGIDSFRLYTHLGRLGDEGIGTLRGATGNLTITDTGRIRRDLEVARFENGVAIIHENENAGSE